jgi:type IV pilus assembly protein PilM
MLVTLNIGSNSIRLLAIKGKRVRTWGEVPLEPGLVQDGFILHSNAVAAAINGLFESLKVSSRNQVIISLSGMSFTYRTLNLPTTPQSIREEAILRGAKKEIPVPIENLYLTWQRVGEIDGELIYFIIGVPRNIVDSLVQTLTEAGVKPYMMDVRGLALARTVNRADAILLSLEPDYFDIVVVANGRPATMHTAIPRGEGANIEDNAMRAVDELTKTIGFYNSSHPDEPLQPDTPLILTGELSTDPTAGKLIEAETGYPVEPILPPFVLPPDFPLDLYTNNIGLALKRIRQKPVARDGVAGYHDIDINLMPEKYRAESNRAAFRRLFVPAMLVIAAGLTFPAYQVFDITRAETARLGSQAVIISDELYRVRTQADEAAATEEVITQLSANLEALQQQHQLLARTGGTADNLEMVMGAIAETGYITAIDIEGDEIITRGQTDSIAAVISFVTALEELEYYSEVRIADVDVDDTSDPSEDTGYNVAFTVVMTR